MLIDDDIVRIICRGCRRQVVLRGIGNKLVGCHGRMRCKECGHRGADLIRSASRDMPTDKKS